MMSIGCKNKKKISKKISKGLTTFLYFLPALYNIEKEIMLALRFLFISRRKCIAQITIINN